MKVFENILSRNLHFEDDDEDADEEKLLTESARDLIERLLCLDVEQRLGSKSGAQELKAQPFFGVINWETLPNEEAQFVPHVEKFDDTSYFDSRGASGPISDLALNNDLDVDHPQDSDTTEEQATVDTTLGETSQSESHSTLDDSRTFQERRPNRTDQMKKSRSLLSMNHQVPKPDFGSFVYKNLSLLEKANNDVVKKLRSDGIFGSKELLLNDSSSCRRHRSLPPLARKTRNFSLPCYDAFNMAHPMATNSAMQSSSSLSQSITSSTSSFQLRSITNDLDKLVLHGML